MQQGFDDLILVRFQFLAVNFYFLIGIVIEQGQYRVLVRRQFQGRVVGFAVVRVFFLGEIQWLQIQVWGVFHDGLAFLRLRKAHFQLQIRRAIRYWWAVGCFGQVESQLATF